MINKTLLPILANFFSLFSLLLCLPLVFAAHQEWIVDAPYPKSFFAFLATLAISLILAATCKCLGSRAKQDLNRRSGILLIALVWILSAILSALPFYFSHTMTHPMDAYFEAMSGLTTTGSTVLIDLEAVSRPILLWRSFLQWIGGMGIVLMFLTILPALGVGGKFLYQLEATGPFKEDLKPRIHETVSLLWKLYLFFTLLEIALLLLCSSGMPLFDAVCTAFSTISTGGFSVRSEGLASYHSNAVLGITLLFMILGSISFSLYFHILRMKVYKIYVPDFFLFLGVLFLGALATSLCLVGDKAVSGIKETFWQGTFQAVSIQTSTGYLTANYELWPNSAKLILFLLMFIGGMSGSTAGGIKTSRFYIIYKIIQHRLESIYRPDSVRILRIGTIEVDQKQSLTVLGFFCIVLFFIVLGTALFTFNGLDPTTSLTLSASFLNNVGTSFGIAGPTSPLTFLSSFDKFLATFWMLFGRLEYYVLLLLFLPSFWKGK